jgi:multidrug efflux pump subunit AcrB
VKGIIGWFVNNRVAANILMFVIVGSGLAMIPTLRVEVFPEFSADIVSVAVPYPGAAPGEVEESICLRIEEELQGLTGIKRITSSAAEGAGAVSIEVLPGHNVRHVLDDVKARVDAIDTFPENAEQPVVSEIIMRAQVINVAVSGDVEEGTLKKLGERVRDELLDLPAITQVTLANARPYEIAIEVSEARLRQYGLSFNEVAQAVRMSSLDVPGGTIKTESGEILLRTKGQAYRGADFELIPLRTGSDGARLLLGDVADVVDGFEETNQSAQFDGKPAVVLQVFRVGDESALDIADATKAYVAEAEPHFPEGVELTTWRDDSKYLSGRMETLIRNGWQGLLLVFLVLTLFLQLRLSFWVTIGIPISFLGTLALMPLLDLSINVLSLFAFILVLGIVVDDAIVVGESVYKRVRAGERPDVAAIAGTRSVAIPVIFAVLTSVMAFVPMAVLPGLTGKIWRVIPGVVIPTLLFSIVESQLILPAHLVHLKNEVPRGIGRFWAVFQGFFASGLESFIDRVYRPVLRFALDVRYATLAVAIGVLVVTAGFATSGRLPMSFFPKLEADDVSVQITMPLGTPAAVTARAVAQLEQSARDLEGDIDAEVVIDHMLASVGEQPWRTAQSQNGGGAPSQFVGAHLGEVHIGLTPSEGRATSATEIVRRWREISGDLTGAVEVEFTSELMSAGKPIDIQLDCEDLDTLRAAADALKQRIAGYPGVFDVSDTFRAGKREVKLEIRPEAEALGVHMADLGRQVRQAFYGEEAQRVQRGRDEVKVMVRYPADERRSLGNLDEFRVRLANGSEVPLATVADAYHGRGYSTIHRTDRRRTLHVTANVDELAGANANTILASVVVDDLPWLLDRYPGVNWSFEGEQKEQRETLDGLLRGFMIALLVIYGLMAIPFRSYVQPLIVMTAIPFGMVGAVLGHVIVGLTLNILSMCGMIALAGIVVNDNLVLIEYINQRRAIDGSVLQAVYSAGAERFRPILLTSLTTFAGLTPLMLETSVQAQFLIPMAVALAFGVLFATTVSLVLVPSLYLILEDVQGLGRRMLAWWSGQDSSEAAKPV